jgi:hypothetical protein
MKKLMSVALTAVLLSVAAPAFSANLYETYSRKGHVKIFVEKPTDKTEKKKVNVESLKSAIEKALKERQSVRFDILRSTDEAELVVETEITEFYWTDHDPVDMIMGLGGTAMDVAKVECYARLTANYKVKDGKSGSTLWSDKLKATLTKGGMSEAQSLELIGDDAAKVLMKEAFGKKRSR